MPSDDLKRRLNPPLLTIGAAFLILTIVIAALALGLLRRLLGLTLLALGLLALLLGNRSGHKRSCGNVFSWGNTRN